MRNPVPALLTILLFSDSIIAPTVNINDNRAVSSAQKGIAGRLIRYYSPNSLGTIPEKTSNGADGFQWFEMGFYCKIVFELIERDGHVGI